jgi:hypothetical protein
MHLICAHEMHGIATPDKEARNRPDILFLGLAGTTPVLVT